MTSTNRTIGYVLTTILVLGAILWGANYWVTGRIKSILDQKVEAGNLTYETFGGNIFTNQMRLGQVRWIDDGSDPRSNIWSFSQVNVSGIDFISYIFHNEINIDKITLSAPDANLYKQIPDSLDQTVEPEKPPTATASVFIKQLEMTEGNLLLTGKDSSQSLLTGQIPFLLIEDIVIDSSTRDHSVPFNYSGYKLTGHEISYRLSDLYHLKVRNLDASDDQLVLDSLEIISPYDKLEFQNHVPYEKAWLKLLVPKIELSGSDIDYLSDTFVLSATKVNLHKADLNIYKDNRQPPNPFFKPLYSRMIRELPVKLSIDSISIVDSDINFQVRTKDEPPPGIVYFQRVNGTISNLNNMGMGQSDFRRTIVFAETEFMGKAPLELNWSFDISNPRDSFLVSGHLSRVTDEEINYFVTPTINIETEGAVDKLAFNFAGNNEYATGDMYIDYDTFQINLLKKDGTSRQAWISKVLNFFLNNKLDSVVEKKGLTVERVQTKSFWHFLWGMVREGTLETIK